MPHKQIVDRLIAQKKAERPMRATLARVIIKELKEMFIFSGGDEQKKVVAMIFDYLTHGHEPTTHKSGSREGEQGASYSPVSARYRQRKKLRRLR